MTTQELEETKRYVLRELPRLLEQDPQFVVFIEGIIADKFPRRDEFARLLDQVDEMQREQRQQGQHVEQRFEDVTETINAQGAQLLTKIDAQGAQLRGEIREQGDKLSQEMRDLRDWVELIAGRLQTRVGRNLEDIVAGALRLGLSRPEIEARNVRMRQKLSDPTGLVYKPGKEKEVDLVAQDGELLVFGVKSAPDVDDVDEFADKVELVRLQNPDKRVTGVFGAVGAESVVQAHCARRGITLIPQPQQEPS